MMKTKHMSVGLLIAVAVGLLNACTEAEEIFAPDFGQPVALTITLPADQVLTRATTDPGVDQFNENKVETIDLFLYRTGATEQEATVHLTIPKKDIEPSEPTADGKVVNTFKARLSKSDLRQLFDNFDSGTNLQCDAFVLVNLPSSIKSVNASDADLIDALKGYTNDEISSTKISELQKLALTCTDFSYSEKAEEGSSHMKSKAPLYFVMSGQNSLTLSDDKRELTGNIDVRRSAAKVTLKLTDVAEKATTTQVIDGVETTTTWVSEREHITVRMRNGLENGFVNAPDKHATEGFFEKNNILLQNDGTETVEVDGKTETHYMFSTPMPLYTYPNDWTTDATHRSSLIVSIQWAKEGTMSWQNTYYEIPIDDQAMKLLSNTHYQIQLKIGVVGSFVESEPYLLDNCSYTILPWGENPETGATMNQVRYLVVNTKEATMNNIIALPIAYSSSHDIDKYDMKLEVRDLRAQDAKWTELVKKDPTGSQSTFSDWNTDMFRVVLPSDNKGNNIGNNQVVVEHDLVNNGDKDSHYSAFRMTFTLRHKDNSDYSETIVVYQYPMVYAEAELNYDYNHSSQANDEEGYVWVNNGQNNNSSNWYVVRGLAGKNRNPNRYIISATTLKDDNYVVGDPRLASVNNALTGTNITTASTSVANWSAKATNNLYNEGKTRYSYYYGYYESTNGDYRTLQFYHPTEESDRTIKMISPEFMVASSYGVCGDPISKENARKRCASYQEDGYPAGRWRVPTKAEISYIIQLSAWGKIPNLFNYGSAYWSANGMIHNSATGVVDDNSTSGYVRCVYDTWYWSDKLSNQNRDDFYWGDKQDANYWSAQ